MTVEIRLKGKYRTGRTYKGQKGGHNNSGKSMGKHVAHPLIHGWRRDKLGNH